MTPKEDTAQERMILAAIEKTGIVREHVPEFIAEVREEWAQVEADRKADIGK